MDCIGRYVEYIRDIRRYSDRTVSIYEKVLDDYLNFASREEPVLSDKELVSALNASEIRQYEVFMLESEPPKSARTVKLHLSAISAFCRFLMKEGWLRSNPVKLISRPKEEKRLPHFYNKESMDEFFNVSSQILDVRQLDAFVAAPSTKTGRRYYSALLQRLIISTLYSLGIRRAELIGMKIGDVDFGRNVVKVRGKGNKMREIPLLVSLSEEILLYLKAVEAICQGKRSLNEPLFVTYHGSALYPKFVDNAVKSALRGVKDIRGQKSPHVLRHSLATELMNGDADLNSIKELLGHSSLAATQVYTHSSIARLKDNYERAHPRAKNGGKNGD